MLIFDAGKAMETGHKNIYGVSGERDTEHQEAKRCILPVLAVELPADKAPQRDADMGPLWVDDSKEFKESRKPEPIFAQILITELKRECLPKNLQKNENDALGNLAKSSVAAPGMEPMRQPLWFDVGKQKVHMNTSIGRPIVNGQVVPAPIILMAMTVQWHGRLLDWVFTSNDVQIFNEMTKSIVQFGENPWGTMLAANLGPKGQGTPLTIAPK